MWGKFIWLISAMLIAYLAGTSPWTKIQARRIWDQFLRMSAGPWRMIERLYRRIVSNLIGRIFLATLGLLLVILLVFWVTHIKFDLFKNTSFKVTGWDDLRTLGWALSGVVATWLAIIGAILSAARTEAMEEDNRIKVNQVDQESFTKALEMLDGDEVASIGAISIISRVGCSNTHYLPTAKVILANYLNKNAKINGEAAEKDLHRSDRKISRLHVQNALDALCDLQRSTTINSLEERMNLGIRLDKIDFSEIRLRMNTAIYSMTFVKCNFSGASLRDSRFEQTNFIFCDFTDADLSLSRFLESQSGVNGSLKGTKMTGCVITATDFSGISDLQPNQLMKCKYAPGGSPINLPVSTRSNDSEGFSFAPPKRITLPPPWQFRSGSPLRGGNQYMTRERAERFWNYGTRHSGPRDRDGNLIKIVYPHEE